MRLASVLSSALLFAVLTAPAFAESPVNAEHAKVIQYTAFLESHPFDDRAPAMRAWLIDWEDKSEDVVLVCAGVLAPVPSDEVAYSDELVGQFIFGNAAYQVANPAEKGKLIPSQVAGMRSLLKAYRAMVESKPDARNSRLEELSKQEALGTLEPFLTPVILASCK
ncbi:hypothetical protein [Dyella tabacisoli]|uniref:Uncharacterized protein n=1 Tax=Dyella tabacisoli TaxID=2282381 RepID=A0A369UL56_9GAMM|nr:hypothetical protein [Dyella tabacisoli]RDD81494.1 hypothetical protein DVJ77_09935 [Dyella tabacisoli]